MRLSLGKKGAHGQRWLEVVTWPPMRTYYPCWGVFRKNGRLTIGLGRIDIHFGNGKFKGDR